MCAFYRFVPALLGSYPNILNTFGDMILEGALVIMPRCFGNRNFMQPMGRLSMHSKCLDFFLLSFGAGIFSFFLCSQHVSFKFPMGSQYVP